MKGRDKTNAAWFLIFEGDPGCKLARDCCPIHDTTDFMMQVWTITRSMGVVSSAMGLSCGYYTCWRFTEYIHLIVQKL